jgi:hypothetical protein
VLRNERWEHCESIDGTTAVDCHCFPISPPLLTVLQTCRPRQRGPICLHSTTPGLSRREEHASSE